METFHRGLQTGHTAAIFKEIHAIHRSSKLMLIDVMLIWILLIPATRGHAS